MTLFELAILVLISAGVGAGVHSFYVSGLIDDCHEIAQHRVNATYGEHAARALEFAKCMSQSRYDPMYDYNRLKGK